MIRKQYVLSLVIFCLWPVGQALAGDNAPYFTSREIDAAYRYQEQFGRRLRTPVNPSGCYLGQNEIPASFQGKRFMVPCRFITETTRHLRFIVEQRAAKYLFPLDMDHANLFIPKDLWATKYSHAERDEALAQLLREPKLIAIYHPAEYLTDGASKIEKETGMKGRRGNSEVWGFFDGSPTKRVSSLRYHLARENLENYQEVSFVHFLAHRLGEFVFSANGKAIPFDLSFDEDFAVVNQ